MTEPNKEEPLLPPDEAQRMAAALPGWTYLGTRLEREMSFTSFGEAISFVDRLAAIAERLGHHPDICISYRRVKLTLSTHRIGGLTAADFRLAAEIDQLLTELPHGR